MPASIAHMVIVHKAFELLRTKGSDELRDFARMIDDPGQRQENDYWKYMNLGSIGPDLYYYVSMVQSGWDMLMEGFVKAAGVVPWSYHLHSSIPNQFPLNLCRILFSDVVRTKDGIEMDADDMRKLAYIAGHLSHIAADQIIHPLVNAIAKPYYRSGKNRKKHRECEVFQDYFLYEEVYRAKRDTASGPDKARVRFLPAGLSRLGRLHPRPDDAEHGGLVPVLPSARIRRDLRDVPVRAGYREFRGQPAGRLVDVEDARSLPGCGGRIRAVRPGLSDVPGVHRGAGLRHVL